MTLVRTDLTSVSIIERMKIVALHGQIGMASDWDSLAGKLAEGGHELKAVDLWSCLECGELRMEEFGRKLNEDQDDGQILLGYSMGGRLALHALIDQPQKWKTAVIISAHPGLPAEERDSRRIVDEGWSSKVLDLPWDEFLNHWNNQGVLGNEVMSDRSLLKDRRSEISRAFRCWSLAEQEDLLEKFQGLETPILWVVGERDEKFCKLGESACSKLQNATMFVISNSGHRVPWEVEGDLADGIIQWFGETL